jgi:hypothetical protein
LTFHFSHKITVPRPGTEDNCTMQPDYRTDFKPRHCWTGSSGRLHHQTTLECALRDRQGIGACSSCRCTAV